MISVVTTGIESNIFTARLPEGTSQKFAVAGDQAPLPSALDAEGLSLRVDVVQVIGSGVAPVFFVRSACEGDNANVGTPIWYLNLMRRYRTHTLNYSDGAGHYTRLTESGAVDTFSTYMPTVSLETDHEAGNTWNVTTVVGAGYYRVAPTLSHLFEEGGAEFTDQQRTTITYSSGGATQTDTVSNEVSLNELTMEISDAVAAYDMANIWGDPTMDQPIYLHYRYWGYILANAGHPSLPEGTLIKSSPALYDTTPDEVQQMLTDNTALNYDGVIHLTSQYQSGPNIGYYYPMAGAVAGRYAVVAFADVTNSAGIEVFNWQKWEFTPSVARGQMRCTAATWGYWVAVARAFVGYADGAPQTCIIVVPFSAKTQWGAWVVYEPSGSGTPANWFNNQIMPCAVRTPMGDGVIAGIATVAIFECTPAEWVEAMDGTGGEAWYLVEYYVPDP